MNGTLTRRKKVVLVVEDDSNMNRFICDLLNECGYNPISADGWNEASGWLDKVSPDLFLLDFMLPGMNADKICRILTENEKTRNIPIIVMSSIQDFSPAFSPALNAAKCFISKPFTVGDLIDEIAKATGKDADETDWKMSSEFAMNADAFLDSYIRKIIY